MKTILYLLLSAGILLSCSSKYGISNAKAYVRKAVAGMVRADDNGRQRSDGVSEQRFVFIETDTSKPLPLFSVAWVNQKPFSVQLIEMNPPYQPIGKTTKGADVPPSPKNGHRLWQLLLQEKPDSTVNDPALQEKIRQNAVVLTGTWMDNNFIYTIAKQEQMETTFYQ